MIIAATTNKTWRHCFNCNVHALSLSTLLIQIIWCLDFVQKNKKKKIENDDMGEVIGVTRHAFMEIYA